MQYSTRLSEQSWMNRFNTVLADLSRTERDSVVAVEQSGNAQTQEEAFTMTGRLRTCSWTGLPAIALVAVASGILQWCLAPTTPECVVLKSAGAITSQSPLPTRSLYTGITGWPAMSATGSEAAVASTERVDVNGVKVHLVGLHYCGIRGSNDSWIVNRSYVSGGLLVFAWGNQGEHTFTASVRHLGSRCAELLNAEDIPPNQLLEYLADGIDDTASSAPDNIHRLLRGFHRCQSNNRFERAETGTALVRAVVALYLDHWRSRASAAS